MVHHQLFKGQWEVWKLYPIMGHSTKRESGCVSTRKKNLKNVDAIWRILAIFNGCKVRLKITFLVLKVTFLSLTKIKFVSQFSVPLPWKTWKVREFCEIGKVKGKVGEFQSWQRISQFMKFFNTLHQISRNQTWKCTRTIPGYKNLLGPRPSVPINNFTSTPLVLRCCAMLGT